VVTALRAGAGVTGDSGADQQHQRLQPRRIALDNLRALERSSSIEMPSRDALDNPTEIEMGADLSRR
jgi:hypothetical protein